jgi:hypothetical protein
MGSPAPKKFKTTPSAGKFKLTAFWDVDGVVRKEFIPAVPPLTLNSGTLQSFKARI